MRIYEDCTESWLAMRAKALYNSYVFPPCMIIQIVGFLSEAFPIVSSCEWFIDSSSSDYMCSARSLSFRKLIVEVGYSILLWLYCIIGLTYNQIFYMVLERDL